MCCEIIPKEVQKLAYKNKQTKKSPMHVKERSSSYFIEMALHFPQSSTALNLK